MGLICNKCYTTYKTHTASNGEICHIENCYGKIIEVDSDFVELIVYFNKLGLTTDFCCSGHKSGSSSAYILFNLSRSPDFLKLSDEDQRFVFITKNVDFADKWEALHNTAKELDISVEIDKYNGDLRMCLRNGNINHSSSSFVGAFNELADSRLPFYRLADEITRLFPES